MIYTIDEIKSKTTPLAKEYNLLNLRLFGSYAKGIATNDSDIDLIMDTGGIMRYIKYSSLLHKLEEVFECSVDLITNDFSNKDFLKKIKKDEVLLYER
ncbi:nucleotidyltransferase domain-containing protein [Methanosphaera sp. ISO3-F5]|uniref:nucleotidyltransferase family protein n=1 Tax=Methanosphaera sp. ISO3-F5 TaxID=1452353 RepID=UPI002B25E7CE|nr:nucleotidyltransferase domain-containing protein [Methanosphaera sp. ISO3-F5]WQH64395.1 nucleotidyltransferase domain-containing protein [Methanosphaera sp. ISO3-F5]